MLRPVIMVGCGGSGQKAVRYVRDAVDRQLRHAGWNDNFPRAWRFIGLDTLTTQEAPGEIPTMPESDYLSVSLRYNIYSHADDDLLATYLPNSDQYKELLGWRPAPAEIKVPLVDGAGQMRAVGRIAALRSMVSVVRPKLIEAFTACRDGGPELQRISELFGIEVPIGSEVPDPVVVVVGSMAGGTGAGIMLDVIDLIRSTDTRGAFPISIVFSSDIFGLGDNISMSANGLAFMSELMADYWGPGTDRSTLISPLVRTDTTGPHALFLIGRTNAHGLDLGNLIHVYRAVGEALATWITSNHVQEEVVNFITVNWQSAAKENMGGYPFGEGLLPGLVSSFGAATLAIGRNRFFDYTSKLITREIVRHLYEGHLQHKDELGQQAEDYSENMIISELIKKYKWKFIQECGLEERGTEVNQISDTFASKEMVRQEASRIQTDIKQNIGNELLEGSAWKIRIDSQARIAKNTSQRRGLESFRHKRDDWATSIFQTLLWTISEYVARYGIKVTSRLVEAAIDEVESVAKDLRNLAVEDERHSDELLRMASRELGSLKVGKVALESDTVSKAIKQTADSIALVWRTNQRNEVASAIEALNREVLTPVLAQLDIGITKLAAIIQGDSQLSSTVDIDGWPLLGKGVPDSFLPSSLELFLEDPREWPDMLDALLEEVGGDIVRSNRTYGYRNNVDAARYLLVSGENVGSEPDPKPILWAKSSSGKIPRWSPGQPAQIELALSNDLKPTIARVDRWLKRPNSRSERLFREGLRDYLSERDSTGRVITDHLKRLTRFKQRLSEAKDKSQPLMEIEIPLSKVVHHSDQPEQIIPLTERFPFPIGHPAREIVSEIFKDHPSVDFTNTNSEAVLISSFLASPLHPMVIPSFTRPVTVALDEIKDRSDYMQSSFWLFRRARTLKGFVPVPPKVLKALIRGFAVARLVGCISVDPRYPARIVPFKALDGIGDAIPIEFPFPLLTRVDQNNILPALLEAFACCFGRVSTKRHNAFDAYEQLYKYGESLNGTFKLANSIITYIETGRLAVTPIDPLISHRLSGADEDQRLDRSMKYLEANIGRFKALGLRSFTGNEYRSGIGSILPDSDILTIEISPDLIEAYSEVRHSLTSRDSGSFV